MSEPLAPGSNREAASGARPTASSYSREGDSLQRKSPVLSIISMISGIVGLLLAYFAFGLLFAIAAVVLGHLGQRKEKAAKGFWLTGLITGYLGVLANVALIIVSAIVLGAALEQIPTT